MLLRVEVNCPQLVMMIRKVALVYLLLIRQKVKTRRNLRKILVMILKMISRKMKTKRKAILMLMNF